MSTPEAPAHRRTWLSLCLAAAAGTALAGGAILYYRSRYGASRGLQAHAPALAAAESAKHDAAGAVPAAVSPGDCHAARQVPAAEWPDDAHARTVVAALRLRRNSFEDQQQRQHLPDNGNGGSCSGPATPGGGTAPRAYSTAGSSVTLVSTDSSSSRDSSTEGERSAERGCAPARDLLRAESGAMPSGAVGDFTMNELKLWRRDDGRAELLGQGAFGKVQ